MGTVKAGGKRRKNRTLMVSFEKEETLITLQALLKQLGIKSRLFTEEEMEDFGLGLLMKQSDKSKTVSYEKVMRKLKGK